jgi:hypothetical protein
MPSVSSAFQPSTNCRLTMREMRVPVTTNIWAVENLEMVLFLAHSLLGRGQKVLQNKQAKPSHIVETALRFPLRGGFQSEHPLGTPLVMKVVCHPASTSAKSLPLAEKLSVGRSCFPSGQSRPVRLRYSLLLSSSQRCR